MLENTMLVKSLIYSMFFCSNIVVNMLISLGTSLLVSEPLPSLSLIPLEKVEFRMGWN